MLDFFLKYNGIAHNLLLNPLYYVKVCNELAGPIFTSLHPGRTASFEEVLQWWRGVGNTVFDLITLRF